MPGAETYQIQLRVDTLENWNSADPTILCGEFAIIKDSDPLQFKVGRSLNQHFSQLPMVTVHSVINNLFRGRAIPSTNPGTIDHKEYYIADTAGTYTGFGNQVLASGEVALLLVDGTTTPQSYSKITLNIYNKQGVDGVQALHNVPLFAVTDSGDTEIFKIDTTDPAKVLITQPNKTFYTTIAGDLIAVEPIIDGYDLLEVITDMGPKEGVWHVCIEGSNFALLPPDKFSEFGKSLVVMSFYFDENEVAIKSYDSRLKYSVE